MCKLHFVRCKANPYIVPVCIRALAVFVCRKKNNNPKGIFRMVKYECNEEVI